MTKQFERFFPLILIIFHIIGLGLFIESDSASSLTWMNLTLCGLLVFLSESKLKSALLVFAIIFTGGFLIELIGTKTGVLFGDYSYGSVLGWRLAGVSLIIGVNWYAIVLAATNVVRGFKLGNALTAIIAGVLCVALDFVIEPVAVKYGFWTWHGGEIPLFNYITWFVFAVLFSFIYLKNSSKRNKTAAWLFFVWLGFFLVLNFI